METPKLVVASVFNVQLYIIENASTQSGSDAIFDCVRPALRTCVFYLIKLNIENGCHVEFWSFHGYKNPQLTLEQLLQFLAFKNGINV